MGKEMVVRGVLVPVLVLAAAGCPGCHDDHPYVPYAIGSADALADAPADPTLATAPSTSASAADAGGDPFLGAPALLAPPGLASWPVEGVTLEAPQGKIFVLAVVRDFDGDGAKDAFAIVRPADGNDPGQLAFYPGTALGAPVTFDPPAQLARNESCAPVDRLVLVGPRTVLAELGAQCPRASAAPVRWVALVAAAATPKVRLAATIADPVGAPALSVDAEVRDRDGDGLDDAALRVTIEGGGAPLEPGPRVSVSLAWLDRRAGLALDATSTEASFATLAASASSRSAKVADAPAVPGYVTQMRMLWRAACAEGGSPRVVGVAPTGAIVCGAGRALENAGLAEVRSYVTMGNPLRAALALGRAQRPPASRTASRTTEAQGWIAQLAPISKARAVRWVSAVPMAAHGHEPSWGTLAFESGGKLLVRTAAGVVRVDPDQGDEAAADLPAWKPAVTSPDGAMRWIEAYDPCDGLPLRATFASGDDMRDVALPVPPPLGGRCAGSHGAPAPAIAVAWGPAGLEAIIGGEPILVSPDLAHASPLAVFLGQPPAQGSPRSPDGKTYVFPTGAGLLVRGPARSGLLRAAELDGTYADQHDCVVSDDATHVACGRAGKAWVGAWGAP